MELVIADAAAPGGETGRMLLHDIPSPITLRELIVCRVRQEVLRHEAGPDPTFRRLIPPTTEEATLNGPRREPPRQLDCEAEIAAALRAFDDNDFFVFVGNRQVDDVDEMLTLSETDMVTFVRVIPLVGG